MCICMDESSISKYKLEVIVQFVAQNERKKELEVSILNHLPYLLCYEISYMLLLGLDLGWMRGTLVYNNSLSPCLLRIIC